MWNLFRSTRNHIDRMRAERAADEAPPSRPSPLPIAPCAYDHGAIRVSADLSSHNVRVNVGLFHFTMSRGMAFEFAKQVEGAADALGPEPKSAKVEEAVDITADVDEEGWR